MKESIQVKESNIPAFSKDWDQREQLTTISLQLDRAMNTITKFGEQMNQVLSDLERRLSHIEKQIEVLDAMLK